MAAGKPNSDRILSIAGVLIAVCSLLLTLYSGYWTRYHNRLSVLPRLSFLSERTEQDPQRGILLSNSGLGPAFIKKWIVSVDNEPVGTYTSGWDEAFKKLNLPHGKGIHYASFETLEAGKQEFIFSINQEQWKQLQAEEKDAFNNALRRITVVIDYDSAYDEHNRCVFDGASRW